MANFDILFDPQQDDEQKPAKTIIGGNPTPEELEDAFQQMFEEEWRNNA